MLLHLKRFPVEKLMVEEITIKKKKRTERVVRDVVRCQTAHVLLTWTRVPSCSDSRWGLMGRA